VNTVPDIFTLLKSFVELFFLNENGTAQKISQLLSFGSTTFSTLSITALNLKTLSIRKLSIMTPIIVCYYAEFHYADCCNHLNVMLSVVLLSVTMLNIAMLSSL
jgi:hypothetical protein